MLDLYLAGIFVPISLSYADTHLCKMSVSVAAQNLTRYGQYPMALTFSHTDGVPDLAESDSARPAYSAAYDPSENIKRHAACDECRMNSSLNLPQEI